jgi:hypothetical protein
MKYIKLFEEFVAESKNNSYPLNEMNAHLTVTIVNALFFTVSVLTIFGFTGEAIDAIKRNIQKLKDVKDKRKINKDSIEDIVNDIEGLINDLPAGKRNFLKGMLNKLKGTIDSEGNIDKDEALYLQREVDKYAKQYGVSITM